MELSCNNFACLKGRIYLPLTGVWTAHLTLDQDSSTDELPLAGQQATLSLNDGAQTFVGTVRRINNAFGTVFANVVGGAGGFPGPVEPKQYQSGPGVALTVGTVLSDLLGSIGETLSDEATPDITDATLSFWTRVGGPGFRAMAALVALNSANWRALPDGTIWIGIDTFPETTMPDDWELLRWGPDRLSVTFHSDTPTILPGQTWQNGQVSDVEHLIEGVKFRTNVWFLDPLFSTPPSPADRFKGPVSDFIQAITAPLDYGSLYSCSVVSQNSDLTLELTPDDASLPGFSNITMAGGVPGGQAQVAPGARCTLFWLNRDPQRPRAALWDVSGLISLILTASEKLSFVAPAVHLGSDSAIQPLVLGETYTTAEDAWFTALVTAFGAVLTAFGSVPAFPAPALATLTTALSTTLPDALTAFEAVESLSAVVTTA